MPTIAASTSKAVPTPLTAATAQQVSPERINLTTPKGDITLADGTWLMLQAKDGVFLQHSNQLDLSQDVILYRDDGTTVTTNSASIDLKNGAAAGAEPTHAEGPFGTLDAQGFTITDKGAVDTVRRTSPPGPERSPKVRIACGRPCGSAGAHGDALARLGAAVGSGAWRADRDHRQ